VRAAVLLATWLYGMGRYSEVSSVSFEPPIVPLIPLRRDGP